MDNVEQVLAVGGGVVIWVVTTLIERGRRRRDGGAAVRSVTGPAVATLWAASLGSRYGLVALVDHSEVFRTHVGDAAATCSDIQGAFGPWCAAAAAFALVSRAVRALTPPPGRAAVAPVGQVPVADLSAGR